MSDNSIPNTGTISPTSTNRRNVIKRNVEKFITSIKSKFEGTNVENTIKIFYTTIMTILFSWAILVISPKRKAKAIVEVPEEEVCRGSQLRKSHSASSINDQFDFIDDINSNIFSPFSSIKKMNDKNKTNHEEEDDNKSTTSSTSSEKIFKPSSISQLLTTDEIIDNLQTSSSNPGMYERVKSGIGLGLFKKTEDSPDNSPPESLYETPNDESSGTYYFYQDHVSKIQSYPPSTNAPYQTTNLYLDSITEEDSDDLRSLSSASSLISPQLIPHTSYSELIARLPSEEENLIEEDNDPSSILDNTTPLGSIIILSHITIEQGEEPEYNDTIEEILSNHSSITSTKSSESRLGHLNITNPEEEENIGNCDLHLSLSPTSLSISGEIAEIEGDNIDIISIKDSASPVDDLLSEATESVTDSVATTFYNNTSISKNKTLNNPEEEILDIFVDEELPLDPFTDNISPSNTIISTGGILNKEIDLKNSHKNQEIVNNRKKEILDNSNMEAHQDRDTSEMIVTDLFARGYPIEETGFLETDRFSPESASIILDRSRDSLLDQSICSNPRDETHIMEAAYVSRHYEEESDDDNKNNDNNKLRQTVTKTFVTTSEGKKEGKRNSDILDEDLPPPPEQLKTVTSYTPQPLRPTILPPAPPSMVPKQFKDSNDSSITSPIDKTPESSGRNSAQRLPQFLYGYGTVGPYQSTGNSPTTTILVTSPWISSVISKKTTESPKTISTISSTEEEVENKNNNGIGKVSKEAAKEDDGASSYPNYFRKYDTTTTSPILHSPNYPESSRSTASTVRNIPVKVTPHTESTSDKLSTHISTDFSKTTMDTHTIEAPGITSTITNVPLTKPYPSDYYSSSRQEGASSTTPLEFYRDDLQSEGRRSRSTIREVPILRDQRSSSSVLGPSSNYIPATTMTTEYRTTSTTPWTAVDGNPHQEEYFRREVTTRTLITRSSETLSQLPYYSRDGSSDRFQQSSNVPLPLPSTTYISDSNIKDDFSEEYRMRYEKITQEEERKIRENQEKRRREEEERRFREEEDRKMWEREENRRLQQIREEKERIEKELASEAARRERDERMRIEKDRIQREEMERKRRAEWDEIERARREAEEKELAKRKEMLEIRLQRERIEIERIEKIKREQLIRERELEMEKIRKEREEAQLQKELEEARLKREAIERETRLAEERERIEAENRERERIQDEIRKRQIAEDEAREKARLAEIERDVREKERLRKLKEQEEHEKLAAIRREEELLMQQVREAQERERIRQMEEANEREKILQLERAAAERRAQREHDKRIEEELRNKARIADEIKEEERRQAEQRNRDRLAEERKLQELKERERQNQQFREQERRQVEERESKRRYIDSRSRERLDELYKKKEELDSIEQERRRLLREREEADKKRNALTSKETLERLTRKPYFSRENLSQLPTTTTTGEITTKIHREIIDKVTRTLVTEDLTIPYGDDGIRDRMYISRKGDDDMYRNDSSRMSKYKTSVDKAKKEFMSNGKDDKHHDPLDDKFKKSMEELNSKRKIEYRGPLLQKFHDDSFNSKSDVDYSGTAYPKMGPSPYEEEIERLLEKAKKQYKHYRTKSSQPNLYSKDKYWENSFVETNVDTGKDNLGASRRTMEETNLDEVHRSRQAYEYTTESTTRYSRSGNNPEETNSHTRSKSADYLLDRIRREETEPPENELQKASYPLENDTHNLSEHELRFRKSTEKLSAPDWYENRQQNNRPNTSVDYYNENYNDNRPQSRQSYKVVQSYENPASGFSETVTKTYNHSVKTYPNNYDNEYHHSPQSKKVTSPVGGIELPAGMFDKYKDEIAEMRRSRGSLQYAGRSDHIKGEQPGYTVSTIPDDWEITTRNTTMARVIEVVDTFTRSKSPMSPGSNNNQNLSQVNRGNGGTTTIDEAMDKIYEKVVPSGSVGMSNDRAFDIQNFPRFFHSGSSIFCNNIDVWKQILEDPQNVEELVEGEKLYIRCSNCPKVKEIHDAKNHYVSCKHCYNYYCSRECRRINYDTHRDKCSYARINTLCKEIIMKVRKDPESQWYMSKIAREGYKDYGRGSVNFRINTVSKAKQYLKGGWNVFSGMDVKTFLFFYPIHTLEEQKKEQSLIALCRKYNPQEKFILSVSIIADVEICPETPPNERNDYATIMKDPRNQSSYSRNGHSKNDILVNPTNV